MAGVRVFLAVLLLLGVALLLINLSYLSADQEDEKIVIVSGQHGRHTREKESTDTTLNYETTAYEHISFSVVMASDDDVQVDHAADLGNYQVHFEPQWSTESIENTVEQYPPRSQETVRVWPQPKSQQSGDKTVEIDLSGFNWEVVTDCDQFYSRTMVYKAILKSDLLELSPNLRDVSDLDREYNVISGVKVIHVDDPVGTWEERVHDEYFPGGDMPFGYNEHYILRIPDGGTIEIEVSCFYGFVAAVNTLKQVLASSEDRLFATGAPLNIQDQPAYPHRGFMIDTGRSFLSKKLIRKTIDAMGLLKLNVLHWHLVDDQSFAVESVKYPQLSRDGAYWMGYVWDHVNIDKGRYSQEDLRELVTYAEQRGIRVIPEVDLPGHCRGWSIAFPNMTVKCPNYQEEKRHIQTENKFMNGDYHVNMPLDVTNPFTLEVVFSFLEEMGDIFHDPAFHIGSDEPPAACWNEDRKFRERMSAIDPHLSPHAYMLQKVRDYFKQSKTLQNRTLTIWDDGVEALEEAGMSDEKSVVQFWRSWGTSFTRKLPHIADNHLLILSPSSWYLDIPRSPEAITDWRSTYKDGKFKQLASSVARSGHLIGGEACAWMMTESYQVSRQGTWPIHYNTLVWHRLISIAENLWVGDEQMPPGTAARYEAIRCLLTTYLDISPAEELHC